MTKIRTATGMFRIYRILLLRQSCFSSDDEVQKAMADIAGVQRRQRAPAPAMAGKGAGKGKRMTEFESDMEDELDTAFESHKQDWLHPVASSSSASASSKPPSSTSGEKKKVRFKESKSKDEGVDPALGLHDKDTHSDEGIYCSIDVHVLLLLLREEECCSRVPRRRRHGTKRDDGEFVLRSERG